MSISVEKVTQAVDYSVRSAFVKKIRGVDPEDAMSIAHEIYESSAMLGSLKKEHENVLFVLSEASKNPELYTKALAETVKKEQADLMKQAEAANQEYDAIPKRDETFIASCQQKLKEIDAEKKAKKAEIRKKFTDEFEASKKRSKRFKKIASICGVLGAFGIIFLVSAIARMDWVFDLPVMVFIIGSLCPTFALLFPFTLMDAFSPKPPSETNIQQKIDTAMRTYDDTIAQINEKIELGYDKISEFRVRMLKADNERLDKLLLINNRASELAAYNTIMENGFQRGISLLQSTVDNFESLNQWAANCVRDQAQKEHNDKMASIEEEKVRAQEAANRAQERAMQQQTDLLQRQAIAAEQQARAAEQQKKDTEEIRQRMERERYGDYWKSYPDN